MQAFNKTFFKFLAGFVAIILLSLAIFSSSDWWGVRQEQKAAEKIVQEMEQRYREDTYGGKTPEETLQLFIDALKAGDIELASKYFVLEKQAQTKDDMLAGQKSGGLETLLKIYSLNNASKHYYDYDNSYEVRYRNSDGAVVLFSLTLNKYSRLWKIESL